MADSLVAVIMGSSSDWETMQHAVEALDKFGMPNERLIEAELADRLRGDRSQGKHHLALPAICEPKHAGRRPVRQRRRPPVARSHGLPACLASTCRR